MNRNFLTIGEQFNSADFCNDAKNSYVGMAYLAQTILGSNTLLNNFTCTPNSPANLSVNVSGGNIYQMAQTDSTTFGALPIDTNQIYKQGINQALTSLTFTPPATPGDSIAYLIEMTFQEADGVSQNRQFYQASSQTVNTVRADTVFIKSLAGTPATTGTQVPPAPEAGFIGAFVVTVANGQTQINSGDISVYDPTKFITEKLQDKISQTTADARYVQLANLQSFAFKAYQNSAQTITPNVEVKVNFDSESFDANSAFNTTTSRFTPTIAGYYSVSANVGVNCNPTLPAQYDVSLYKNSTRIAVNTQVPRSGATTTLQLIQTANTIVFLNGSTDYIEAHVSFGNPSDTTDRTLVTGLDVTYFCGHKID